MPQNEFARAELKSGQGRQVIITDTNTIERVLSFFPGVGQGKASPDAGGWESEVEVVLTRLDGRSVVIRSDFESWSEGPGDWPVKGNLKSYVEHLLADKGIGNRQTVSGGSTNAPIDEHK